MVMNNDILLRRKNMLVLNLKENIVDMNTEEGIMEQAKRDSAIASIAKNITAFGFILNTDMLNQLRNSNYKDIVDWYLDIANLLKDVIGLRDNMEPLYKNFPEEVMNTDDTEMYIASLTYFLSHNTISPSEANSRPELNEFCNLIQLAPATQEVFDSIFTNLLSSKISFGNLDIKDIAFFVEHDENFVDKLPESIPNKENLVSLTKLVIDKFGYDNSKTISLTTVYKTATDVLRLATALSNGDVSLAEKTTYKHFNKAERRFILSLLNGCKNPLEDMLRYKKNWIVLGEILHPGSYVNRYPNAYSAFSKLRSGAKIKTYGGKIEEAFEKKNLTGLLKLLSSRPGEFCRRLDRTLSAFNTITERTQILDAFSEIAENVETTVLIGLMSHMYDRTSSLDSRIFFPKGRIAKAYVRENTMKEIDDTSVNKVIEICHNAIVNSLSTKENMGKVYIDEAMKNFVFPMVIRNANRTLHPMARGSKMVLKPDCTTARVFVYWHETENIPYVDLDLSVALLDENYKLIGTCYYGNLSAYEVKNRGCYHSGDVREAPEGAAEYIDLDFDKLIKAGTKYVMVAVHSYSSQPFCELKEAFVGVMEREKPNDGRIFEPATVVNRSDLITEQRTSLSMVLDVDNKTVTWLDLGSDANHIEGIVHNINSTNNTMIPITKAFTQRHLMSIYDIITMNVEARGTLVDDKADADYIFSLDGYIAPDIVEDKQDIDIETTIEMQTDADAEVEQKEVDVEDEEIVEPPKHILITPYDMDTLIANYL